MNEDKIYDFEQNQKAKFPWLFGRIRKLQPPKRLRLHLASATDVFDW
jgi:3-isopropylmalate dehydratase